MTVRPPLILAIDTSCDDTSAAVTCGTEIWSNIVASQTELHKKYGGVFPTVAKLAHAEAIEPVVRPQLTQGELSAIAVTVGPGLAPALEVGINYAKGLAQKLSLPLLAVNHMEGHLLSPLATARPRAATRTLQATSLADTYPAFPVLSILVSGGHTEFVLVHGLGEYELLGSTLDDAAGECLDKIGRMLNLGYPAGPIIEEFAKLGDPSLLTFPLPLTQVKDFNLSFSGLKTFARNTLEAQTHEQPLSRQEIYNFCASAQAGVFRHITYKLTKVLQAHPEVTEVWLGGGVAANMALRKTLRTVSKLPLRVPRSKKLCADNAAMIGIAASRMLSANELVDAATLERKPRLTWNNL